MASENDLRNIILKSLSTERNFQFNDVIRGVKAYYSKNNLGHISDEDERKLNKIVWDLIVERILTLGTEDGSEPKWPFLRFTEYGKEIIESDFYIFADPHEYIKLLKKFASSELDKVIEQYSFESIRSFNRSLYFSSAVMIGAASERVVLLLLESINKWCKDPAKNKKIKNLLEQPKLPSIFEIIQSTLEGLIKNKEIPYSVHQGSITHLLSLFEMIRVHRNKAVHPIISHVDKSKVFLSILSFPFAFGTAENLIEWFQRKL